MQKSAEESPKTKKMREKLRKRLEEMERELTPQALKRTTFEIQRWIDRHASERVTLKSKISLFDGNQNSATLSQKVAAVMKKLQG